MLATATGALASAGPSDTQLWGRIYLTQDGGDTWLPPIVDPLLAQQNPFAISVRAGRLLLATAGLSNPGGLFYRGATDTAFTNMFPNRVVTNVLADPTNGTRLFASVNGLGIFRSETDGASWEVVSSSNAELHAAIQNPGVTRVKLAFGRDGRLFASLPVEGDIAWVGYTTDRGQTWTAMDVPRVPNPDGTPPLGIASIAGAAGSPIVITSSSAHGLGDGQRVRITGVQGNAALNRIFIARVVSGSSFTPVDQFSSAPLLSNGSPGSGGTFKRWISAHAGGMTNHGAIAVDATDSNFVYVSGDVGPLYAVRGNATVPRSDPQNVGIVSEQWTPIFGSETASNTAPHADSRDMAFDGGGRLLHSSDGGIVWRSNARFSSGDWIDRNGNLGCIEMHDLAVDELSGLVTGGLQDNGTVVQNATEAAWDTILGADGGDVQVDFRPGAATSQRYFSAQFLGDFRHQAFDANGNRVGNPACVANDIDLTNGCDRPLPGNTGFDFINHFELNRAAAELGPNPAAPVRMVVAKNESVYESFDAGKTLVSLSAAPFTRAMAYGHPSNFDALWAVGNQGAFRRLQAGQPLAPTADPIPLPPDSQSVHVVMSAADPQRAYVVSDRQVLVTADGDHWQDITGDLVPRACGQPAVTTGPSRAGKLYSIEYVASANGDRVFIGGGSGVFMATPEHPGVWTRVSENLPNAVAHDLDYDRRPNSDALVVALYGRGAWRLPNASTLNRAPVLACLQSVVVAADASCQGSVLAQALVGSAVDPDGDAVSLSTEPPGPTPLGASCIRVTGSDGLGAAASCDASIDVRDVTPPVFTSVPGDVTTSSCGTLNIGTATASDNCDTSVTVTSNRPARFPPGTTIVTWTATDEFGNVATATQRVTVSLGNDPACCPAETNVIVGTSGDNMLNGTNGADCILGLGGQDTINGLGGNDFISGGDGNDGIDAGAGNDVVFGGAGQDSLVGGAGNDVLAGGDGDDNLQGGIGDDRLSGGQGQDTLQGQDGNDVLNGDDGDDNLQGGNGNDDLIGGVNNDTCNGGAGVNTFAQCEFGAPNSCTNGIQNGTETDVDCGGACSGCAPGDTCGAGSDCQSHLCSGGICQAPPAGGGSISTDLSFSTDWGSGYCAVLNVKNNSAAAATSFVVNIDTNASSIYTSWNANFSGASGNVSVTPCCSWNSQLDPGETDASIGFCANRTIPGSGALPIVVSSSGTF